jgi:MFS family permease
MYRLDWVEQLKLGTAASASPKEVAAVSPAVWKLGVTSFLTDVSAEMVNSVLPVYLVLYLHTSPLQYGAVDGFYNGFAVALLSLAGGLVADRNNRHKEVAVAGYGLSAICKLALLAAGAIWTWIAAIVALDRVGKGIRTAPRDALISLHTRREHFGTAFAVHRMLDAGGMLIGPIVAFALLSYLPAAFDVIWVSSFVFAVLGVAVLWLFVPKPGRRAVPEIPAPSLLSALRLFQSRQFAVLAGCGLLLALVTISDGFFYLQLQRKGSTASGFFPLFYVVTASFYMIFSVPVGRIADRHGRTPVFLAGYALLALTYCVFELLPAVNIATQIGFLCILGLYYAATEGVLMAMGSMIVPPHVRTSGLAILATVVGLGKLGSALLFGWLWQTHGSGVAVTSFAVCLMVAVVSAALALYAGGHEQFES